MARYDYRCSDGFTFEDVRTYGDHRSAPDPRGGGQCELVWLSSANVWTDEWGIRAERKRREALGQRPIEPGINADADRAVEYRRERQDRERRKFVGDVVSEI